MKSSLAASIVFNTGSQAFSTRLLVPLDRGHAIVEGGPLHLGAVLVGAGEEPDMLPRCRCQRVRTSPAVVV